MAGTYKKSLTMPDGKRKYFYGKSKKEVEEKIRQARYEIGQGIDISSDITFGELAEIWYNVYKKPRLNSPNSRSAVLNVLNNHLLPVLAPIPVRQITAVQVQVVINNMAGRSASLQNKALQTLKSIFRMAIEDGIISKSPITMSVRTTGKKTEEKLALTPEQADRLLQAVAGTNAETFVMLGLYAGLRRGEILGLQWADIDFGSNQLHVRHNALLMDGQPTIVSEQLKTQNARRDIPMPSALAGHLRTAEKRSKSPFVVAMRNGDPMSKSAFRALWRIVEVRTVDTAKDPKQAKKIGTSPKNHPNVVKSLDFHVSPHVLRHTYITRLFEAGVDLKAVQYLAGHATPDMTLKVYIHYLKNQRQEEAAQKIEDAFG
jgi:integrase